MKISEILPVEIVPFIPSIKNNGKLALFWRRTNAPHLLVSNTFLPNGDVNCNQLFNLHHDISTLTQDSPYSQTLLILDALVVSDLIYLMKNRKHLGSIVVFFKLSNDSIQHELKLTFIRKIFNRVSILLKSHLVTHALGLLGNTKDKAVTKIKFNIFGNGIIDRAIFNYSGNKKDKWILQAMPRGSILHLSSNNNISPILKVTKLFSSHNGLNEILISSKEKLIILTAPPENKVIKACLSKQSVEDTKKNEVALNYLTSMEKIKTAQGCSSGWLNELYYSVESKCEGIALKTLGSRTLEKEIILSIMNEISTKSDVAGQNKFSLISIFPPDSNIFLYIPSDIIVELELQLKKAMLTGKVQLGIVHHDLSRSNIFYDRQYAKISVIDWDESHLHAPIPLNIPSYLFSLAGSVEKTPEKIFEEILLASHPASKLYKLTQELYLNMNQDVELHELWVKIHWLIAVNNETKYSKVRNSKNYGDITRKIIAKHF